MQSNWKICPNGDVLPQYSGLYATMNTKGDIVISRLTWQRLGEAKAFLVMFDPVNNRIGLKPTHPTFKNAYPIRVSNRTGAKLVRGYRLTKEFGIKLPVTMQFVDPEIDDDGILTLDLRTAKPSKRAIARQHLMKVRRSIVHEDQA
jgi:hypothetical protein